MANNVGLRVTVDGDLPTEVLDQIADAVREATLREVAKIDLLADLSEDEQRDLGRGNVRGFVGNLPGSGS